MPRGPCRPGDGRFRAGGALLEQLGVAQPGQEFPEFGIGADQDALELVDGLGAGRDRRAFGELDQPQHLHRAVARLRRGPAGQHGSGSGFGVDGVGLAVTSAG
ncbi:hypothetical protein [Streptomyces sp. YIM 121038]|uniref:hypothetical protein n=1 Tax=Streptomyces sp. YIM 121038 TaxID=2136401 RepID=UPI0031FEE22D